MARKVILDVDPGVDDAVAICLALAAPELDVLAVTAVGGNVPADQATRNVQAIIEQLDPPRLPRIGAAVRPERDPLVDSRHVCGADGLGNADFAVAELHHVHPSDKVITDEIRKAQLNRPIAQQTNNHLVRHRLLILERLLEDIMIEVIKLHVHARLDRQA